MYPLAATSITKYRCLKSFIQELDEADQLGILDYDLISDLAKNYQDSHPREEKLFEFLVEECLQQRGVSGDA